MGLLQLTFSVKELAFTLGSAGIRTCAVYLTAESLGRGRPQDARAVLRGCFRYALVLGTLSAAARSLPPCASARCFCRCDALAVCWMPTALPLGASGS